MISIAPMLDRTDSAYRQMMRLLTRHSRLYTEMVVASTLIYGNPDRHLAFDERERPLILQLASDRPEELFQAVSIAEAYPYDGYNLNIGCPSKKAQQRQFGVCQMAYPEKVALILAEMQRASNKPISVKHRIGIEGHEDYAFLQKFVDTLYQAGIRHFIIHARIAILQNFSPKANRQIPPLRYEDVYRLKQDFPDACIEINGGIRSIEEMQQHLQRVDQVMIGREAYDNPLLFRDIDQQFFHSMTEPISYDDLIEGLIALAYCPAYQKHPNRVLRHALGLFKGWPRAKHWRSTLCRPDRDPEMIRSAYQNLSTAVIFSNL